MSTFKEDILCKNHFPSSSTLISLNVGCVHNLGPYNTGLATELFLKEGSIPTIRGERTDDGNVSVLCTLGGSWAEEGVGVSSSRQQLIFI